MPRIYEPSRSTQVAVTSWLFVARIREREELMALMNRLDLEAIAPPYHLHTT